MKIEKVNLLIIGTQKAGTTSLYYYLKQNRGIYFSEVKEITYFLDDYFFSKGENYYHSFFSKYSGQRVIASSCVHMLPCSICPERVYKYNPNMKFIVILRDPVKRAFSAYNYALKNGWETENNSFMKTLELEKERLKSNLPGKHNLTYFYNGLYYKHLSNWMRYFPQENFLLLKDFYLKNNPKATLLNIFEFLKIHYQDDIDTSKEYNRAGASRSKFLQKFLLSKNSRIKTFMGNFLNQELKVFIRANVLPWIYKFNTKVMLNESIKQGDYEILMEYFKDDLKMLESEFGIIFNG